MQASLNQQVLKLSPICRRNPVAQITFALIGFFIAISLLFTDAIREGYTVATPGLGNTLALVALTLSVIGMVYRIGKFAQEMVDAMKRAEAAYISLQSALDAHTQEDDTKFDRMYQESRDKSDKLAQIQVTQAQTSAKVDRIIDTLQTRK